ncbi:BTAD domain-containing putative transcriptional regulator [Kitasatospora sp. NPDC059827]|uniref:BTAD domain-containing putative transcriptional regulator n=1 Tax=Kitasatospora sp. NPDC059827 TaxID=3346964 RepID=UPI003666B9E6
MSQRTSATRLGGGESAIDPYPLGPDPLGPRLQTLRARAGLNQDTAAALAGISTRALRDIERGRVHRPQPRTLRRLAEALGLTGDEQAELLAAAPAGPPSAADRPVLLILGPLALRRGRAAVPVTSPMLRRLLGLLALKHPGPATQQEITDTLWPAGPPPSQQSLVHTYVSQARHLLEPGGPRTGAPPAVLRTPTGYRLAESRIRTDLGHFDELLHRAGQSTDTPDREAGYEALTRALRSWRGPVLADADPVLRRHPAAVAAGERRIDAALRHADAALLLHRPAEALPGLRDLAHAEPLHEGLHARLILALAGHGEQAAALGVFQRLRGRLDEELGIEPGAEVREAHLRVLRGHLPPARHPDRAPTSARPPRPEPPARPLAAPPAGPVPAQLPAGSGPHVGRRRQLADLDALLAPDPARRARVVAVVGGPGTGKTALATHWSHERRAHFPDGQLFADLRGHSPLPALCPGEVLARFLRALGTPPERLPADEHEAAALYRTLLADRRMLILLDDARDAEQVRPLIPGAHGCAVVLTSRSRLAGLVAGDGARRTALDALDPDEGRRLLGGIVGDCRVAAEPEAADRLVRLCDGLPLAIRIAGANVVARGVTLAEHCAELADDDPLTRLAVPGDRRSTVRAAFEFSYRALPAEARRLFRLLGRTPGPDLTVDEAAALAGTTPVEAAALLACLADAHLTRERTVGRYGLHGLLRAYARELAGACEPAGAQDRAAACSPRAARGRPGDRPGHRSSSPDRCGDGPTGSIDTRTTLGLVSWKRGRLHEAAEHFAQVARQHRTLDSAGAEAIAHTNLGIVHRALGRPGEAIRALGETLPVHLRHGNRFSESVALNCLSGAYTDLGDHTTGRLLAHTALAAGRALGDRALEANALLALGAAQERAGDPAGAADSYREARLLAESADDRFPLVAALVGLAAVQAAPEPRAALRTAEHAVTLAREAGFRMLEGCALTALAGVRVRLGESRRALELGRDALAVHRDTGHRPGEARSQLALGLAQSALGAPGEAIGHWREALRLARSMGAARLR